jgi:hypothetical protein
MLRHFPRSVNSNTNNTTPPAGAGDEAILARLLGDIRRHPQAPLISPIGRPDHHGRIRIVCPLCGDTHIHGEGYGHRCPHCSRQRTSEEQRRSGYIIAPPHLVERLRREGGAR